MGKPCRVTFGERVFFKPDFVKRFLDTLHLEDSVVEESKYLKSIGYDNAFNEGDPLLIREKKAEAKAEANAKDVENTAKALEKIGNIDKFKKLLKSFSINDVKQFFHASGRKRKGKLYKGVAPQFGEGVYFSTNKDLVVGEFGDNVTEVALTLKNPVFTSTKQWYEVESKALELADEDYGKRNGLTLEEGEEYFRYDKEYRSDVDEIDPEFISRAAEQLGYDAIIDKDSNMYENEISVLDESRIIYEEDMPMAIAEEYHRAKADGSNPELVKAVDELLTPKKETEKPTKKEDESRKTLSVYHGGNISDLDSFEEGVLTFVTENKTEAKLYAKGNDGNLLETKIDPSKIADEDLARDELEKMGFPKDEFMLYELIDPRFEESYIGEDNVAKLFSAMESKGYESIRFTDSGLNSNTIENIVVFNPSTSLSKDETTIYARFPNARSLFEEGFRPIIDGNVQADFDINNLDDLFDTSSEVPMKKPKAEPNIFDDFDASRVGGAKAKQIAANRAFAEKHGEDAAVAKAISSNFEAIADELKAKGIFTKIEC